MHHPGSLGAHYALGQVHFQSRTTRAGNDCHAETFLLLKRGRDSAPHQANNWIALTFSPLDDEDLRVANVQMVH